MRNLTMNRFAILGAAIGLAAGLLLAGCSRSVSAQENAQAAVDGAPPPAQVEAEINYDNFKVDHPDQFPSTTAGEYTAYQELQVTGVVQPDVSRQVQVPSLATGRIVEVDARLGDEVKKGQLLFKVRSTDISGAYSDYRQAVKNEELTKLQLDRSKTLFEVGAYPKSALEIAQNAEDDNIVVLETTIEHLKLLGSDPKNPNAIFEVTAPVSGTITDQEIQDQTAVQAYNTPMPFTISDLSKVWIVCDVFENNMAQVHLGQYADIRLNAYPDKVLKARISNILPVMDPNIRTAKVRLEVDNPGILRLGMFVTASFRGDNAERHATVPTTAILHLHDREWVYSPIADGHFRRYEVLSGNTLPNNMQEIVSGIQPGQQVVTNALMLQDTSEK
ncbi:MAG TPA: efflux RND transporter periplasmic adaptor subunit [Bryobacteraceae bacterium]